MKRFILILIPVSLVAALAYIWMSPSEESSAKRPSYKGSALESGLMQKTDKKKREFKDIPPVEEKTEKKRKNRALKDLLKTQTEEDGSVSKEDPVRKMMGSVIESAYGDFFKDMSFSKEKSEKVSNLLLDNQMILQTLLQDLGNDSISDEKILEQEIKNAEKQQRAMDKILSTDEQESLKDYQLELPIKTTKKMMKSFFKPSDGELSPEEESAIAKIWMEEQTKNTNVPKTLLQAQNKPGWVNQDNLKSLRGFIKGQRNPANIRKMQEQTEKARAATVKRVREELGREIKSAF